MTKKEKLKQAITDIFNDSPCLEDIKDKELYINKTFEVLSKKYDNTSESENAHFFMTILYGLFFKKNWDDNKFNSVNNRQDGNN